jgi:hypothetical protein
LLVKGNFIIDALDAVWWRQELYRVPMVARIGARLAAYARRFR